MAAEAVAALLVGLAMLAVVLYPLMRPATVASTPYEPEEEDETPKGVALAALREIEFDRETGKLSDDDYTMLKAKYTAYALDALRTDAAASASRTPDRLEEMIAARVRTLRAARGAAAPPLPSCPTCGPRPEPDATFCSTCGARVDASAACTQCAATLAPGSRFCERCGSRVAA